MLTAEQVEERRLGIGGSDLAAVLGIDPYRQPIDVFYDKRPDLAEEHGYYRPPVEGDAVDFGNYVEEPIAQLYSKKTGKKVRRSNVVKAHKAAHWLRANIDRDVVGERRGLEIKSVNWRLADRWGESGTDQVAEYYLPQVMHYLLVMDYSDWDVAALIGGATDFRIYHIQRDAEWDDLILDTTRDFWINHVEKGIPPAIDVDHAKAGDVIKRVYRLVNGEEVTLPSEAEHWHQVRLDALDKAKAYQAVADSAKYHLESLAGNAGKFRIPGVKGAYVREKRHRDAYQVEASDYIVTRYSARMK